MSLRISGPAVKLDIHAHTASSILSDLMTIPYDTMIDLIQGDIIPALTAEYAADFSSMPVAGIRCSGNGGNVLVFETLTRACLYIAGWCHIMQDNAGVKEFINALSNEAKPWTNASVNRAIPSQQAKRNNRQVRDFDLGSLSGGRSADNSAMPTQKQLTLAGLEDFSKELLILESLLPLYLENI